HVDRDRLAAVDAAGQLDLNAQVRAVAAAAHADDLDAVDGAGGAGGLERVDAAPAELGVVAGRTQVVHVALQDRLDLVVGEGRVEGPDEGRETRHVRGGHRGAGQVGEPVVDPRRVDVLAGRRQVAFRAEVREGRDLVLVVGRADAHAEREGGGEGDGRTDVVAGGGDHEDARV